MAAFVRAIRSPYAVLGLKPGADRAAVERAYRRLIKQHHPDLSGGDPAIAAELNHAYALLKESAAADPAAGPTLVPQGLGGRLRRRVRGRAAGLLMLAVAAGAAFLAPPSGAPPVSAPGYSAASTVSVRGAAASEPASLDLRGPPDENAIEKGVAAAARLNAEGGANEALRFSRHCEEDLRTYPSRSLLDHCLAFDAASGLLSRGAPHGRFRAEDMAARHVGAALRVSNDPLLAEERVGEIRRRAASLLLRPKPVER